MENKNVFIAHRGLFNNINIPENSLLAFQEAINKKMTIELDIQITKDNVPVIYHDKNLKRLTKIDKKISELTIKELFEIKLLNTDEPIPTLNQVLKLVNGQVPLDIEIKSTNKVNKSCKLILENLSKYSGPFSIKSFDPRIVRWFKRNCPDIERGLLIEKEYPFKPYNKIAYSRLIIKYCSPNFLAISKYLVNNKTIQKYRKKYPIHIWTITEQDFNKYKKYGEVYICNNLPFKIKS